MKNVFLSFVFFTIGSFAFSQDTARLDMVFNKVENPAKFPGGSEAWLGFLTENLRANVASDDGAPVGIYTVKVQFVVDKEGDVRNVQGVEVPKQCPSCLSEAVRVLTRSPKWIPATQNGRIVNYQAVQFISLQVEKEKKRAGRSRD